MIGCNRMKEASDWSRATPFALREASSADNVPSSFHVVSAVKYARSNQYTEPDFPLLISDGVIEVTLASHTSSRAKVNSNRRKVKSVKGGV